eukprot:CAMPEP_0201506858 /NCGR_PEP_ID=MMETSP0161_2-20130828/697_1 /ASSEMBLY_ACC=CAM_ASM_000251 /TAXON_ID=180227 /ORGANISM="Neoparamoeba aestuarina, Strain SoJaBio B1-5/56/2" /LENGTH=390 /DNA_ID=CAMNT_0047901081 /DNA_START=42 /DNA_END=1214 /DNA_ORIENTATION=+
MKSLLSAVALLLVFACVDVSCNINLEINVWYPKSNLISPLANMYLRGDNAGLNWDKGKIMDYVEDDHWRLTLTYTKLAQKSRFELKVLVNDDQWQIGCNTRVFLPTDNSSITLYPFFKTYNGDYEVTKNIQNQGNNSIIARPLVIYTPPSYYENTYKIYRNVLVMQDGQNLFNDKTSFAGVSWRCQDTVDRLVVQSMMEEIVIVGVYNTINRIDEYTYSVDPQYGGGEGDEYLDYLESSVYPYVSDHYRVELNQENLGIMGSSLGGLISCYAGWTRPSVYSTGGCMSSSFWWNSEDFDNTILNEYPPPDTSRYQVYLDSGNQGGGQDDVEETIRVRDHIDSLGYQLMTNEWYYLDDGGEHNEYFWGQRFWHPMELLYPPTQPEICTPMTN